MSFSEQLQIVHEQTDGIEFIDFGFIHEFRLYKRGQVHAYSFGDYAQLNAALHQCGSDAASLDRNITWYEAALLTKWMRTSVFAKTAPAAAE